MATPRVTPESTSQSLSVGQSRLASELFRVSEGNPVLEYRFADSGEGASSGYFSLNGVRQDPNALIVVAAADLGNLRWVSGSDLGTETLWVRAANAEGLGAWASFTMSTTAAVPNTRPQVTVPDRSFNTNQSLAVSTLFNATDAENDAITEYRFSDAGEGANSGYFSLNGVRQNPNTLITVAAANLGALQWVGGAEGGSDTVWFRAADAGGLGAWASATFTTTAPPPNARPVVTVQSRSFSANQSAPVSTLFSATDAENDAITEYRFSDSGEGTNSGYFSLNGVRQNPNTLITVAAANLGTLQWVGGAEGGTDTVWFRAADAGGVGAWASATFTTTAPPPNARPVVTVPTRSFSANQSAAVSTLFSATDAENDAITEYRFSDAGEGANSGYFSLNGVRQNPNTLITVAAANLSSLQWVSGAESGTDTVWVRAADAGGVGPWASATYTTEAPPPNARPVVTVSNRSFNANQAVAASTLFGAIDPEGHIITGYHFVDSGEVASSGYFNLNGVKQNPNTVITVIPANLGDLQWVGGSQAGSDTVWIRATDFGGAGTWASALFTTNAPPPNARPQVAAQNRTVASGQRVSAQGLFTASDSENDAIVEYRFSDSGDAPSSGYFEYLQEDNSRVRMPANTNITVNSLTLMFLSYVGGTEAGSETLWVRAADAGGLGPWTSFTITTTPPAPNARPMVSAAVNSVFRGQNVPAATLFNASDADNDAIVEYRFDDEGVGQNTGYFSLNGVRQPNSTLITVAAANLGTLQWVGGAQAGTDSVWIRAADAGGVGPWLNFNIATLNRAPSVNATNASTPWGQSLALAPLLSASDPEGDTITQYEFEDQGASASSGYLTFSGERRNANTPFAVPVANLGNVHFVGGTVAGAESLRVRVFDGGDWSAWMPFTLTTQGNAPAVSASDATVGALQSVAVSTLVAASDADGDTITQYQFSDSGDAATSGHFTLNGVAQGANVAITVDAANLGQLTYVGGENPGTETLWARANDGSGWGPWRSWNMTSAIRFEEVIGTSGNDIYQSGALGTDKIYFGLASTDSFLARNGDEVVLMGGAGSDNYMIGSITDAFITVFENGGSSGDFIQPGLIVDSDTAILATIDNRHLLLGDANPSINRFVLVIDWKQPANQIENWFIGGPPEIVGSGNFSFSAMEQIVALSQAPNFTFDELVAEAPETLAGFSSTVFNEMLQFYTQRENRIANNLTPVVTANSVSLRAGRSVPLSNLFSVTDPNGDPIVRYEIFMVSSGPGYVATNGIRHFEQRFVIDAGDLAASTFEVPESWPTPMVQTYQVSAYDGIAWSGPTSAGVDITVNNAPEITFLPGNMRVPVGRSVPVSSWIQVFDRNGDTVTQFEFTDHDLSAGTGHYELAGVVQTGPFIVTAAQLDSLLYVAPAGSDFFEQVSVSAFDGETWSGEPMGTINATATGNRPPELRLTSQSQMIAPGQPATVSAWFTAVDPDGDPIVQFRFFDHNPASSGYFQLNGVAMEPELVVTPADLGNVTYAPDPGVPGQRPWSGDAISIWVTDVAGSFTASPSPAVYTTSNRRPTLTANDAAVGLNQTVAFASLVGLTASDPDGDQASNYLFEDLGVGPSTGYFVLDGVRLSSIANVSANQIGQLQYRGGSAPGTETIRAHVATNATLGTTPTSDWILIGLRSGDAQADGAGNTSGSARVVSVGVDTTQTFDDVVADSDPLDYYRLDVAAPGNLVLALTELGGNADLQMLDNGGSVLASSLNPDNWSERITQNVAAGTYYARITPAAGHDASYHFAVSLV